MFRPRAKQQEVLDYAGGKMGVSAVPGSGKTATLSYLAARLVAQADLTDDQEVLIVTLVKSAVGIGVSRGRRTRCSPSFFSRIKGFVMTGVADRAPSIHELPYPPTATAAHNAKKRQRIFFFLLFLLLSMFGLAYTTMGCTRQTLTHQGRTITLPTMPSSSCSAQM